MDMASQGTEENAAEGGHDTDLGEGMWESFDELPVILKSPKEFKSLEMTEGTLFVFYPPLELEECQEAGVIGKFEPEQCAELNSSDRKNLTSCSSQDRSIFSPLPHGRNIDRAIFNLDTSFGGISLEQAEEPINFEFELLHRSPGENELQIDQELSVTVKENSPKTCLNEAVISKKEMLTPPVGSDKNRDMPYPSQTHAMSSECGILKSADSHKSKKTPFPSNTSSKKTASKLKSSDDEETTGYELRTTNLTKGSVMFIDQRIREELQKLPSVSKVQYPVLGNLVKDPVGRILPAKTRNKRKLYYNNQNDMHMTTGDLSGAPNLSISHFEEDQLCIFVKEYFSSGDSESTVCDFSSSRDRRKRVPFGRLPSEARRKSSNGIPRKEDFRKSIGQRKNVSESIKSSATIPNPDAELSHNNKNPISPDLISQSTLETDPLLRRTFPGNSVQIRNRENSSPEGDTVSDIAKSANEELFLCGANNKCGLVRKSGGQTLSDIPQCKLTYGMHQLRTPSCELDADSEQSPEKPVGRNEELFLNQLNREEIIKSGRPRLSRGVPRNKLICRLRSSRPPSGELDADSEPSPEKPLSEKLSTGVPPRTFACKMRPSRKSL